MYETKLRRDFPRDINNVPLHAFCRLLPTHAMQVMCARIKELPAVAPDASLDEVWQLDGDKRARLYWLLCREFQLPKSDFHLQRLKRSDATVQELHRLLQALRATVHDRVAATPPHPDQLIYEVKCWLEGQGYFWSAGLAKGSARLRADLRLNAPESEALLNAVLATYAMRTDILVKELLREDPPVATWTRYMHRHCRGAM